MLGLVVYVGFQTPYRCVWKWGYHGIPPLYDVVFFPFLLYCSWGLGSCTTLRLPQHGHLIWTMLILTNKIKGVPEEKNSPPRFHKKKTQPSDTVFLSVRGCNVASLVISPLVPGLPMVFVYQLKCLSYRKYISKWRVYHRVLHSIIKPMVKIYWICSFWG